MISHGGISEICDRITINSLGLSQEQFYSLPYEYQKALILGHIDMVYRKEENMSKTSESQNVAVKKKLLEFFKRNK